MLKAGLITLGCCMLVGLATVPLCGPVFGTPRVIESMADIHSISKAVETFRDFEGRYPSHEEGLELLVRKGFIPPMKDRWGRPYIYRHPGRSGPHSFDVYSCGQDGVSRTGGDDADDVNNWNQDRTWLYEAYGFTRKERAELFEASVNVAWGLALGALVASIAYGRRRMREPQWPAASMGVRMVFGAMLMQGILTRYLLPCFLPAAWAIAAAPILTVTVLCLLVPRPTTAVLAALGGLLGEILVLAAFNGLPGASGELPDNKWLLMLLFEAVSLSIGLLLALLARKRQPAAPISTSRLAQ